jgi:hypothetical protein
MSRGGTIMLPGGQVHASLGVCAPPSKSAAPLPGVHAPSLPFAPSHAPSLPCRFAWSATVEIHLTFAYAMSACSINGG